MLDIIYSIFCVIAIVFIIGSLMGFFKERPRERTSRPLWGCWCCSQGHEHYCWTTWRFCELLYSKSFDKDTVNLGFIVIFLLNIVIAGVFATDILCFLARTW